MPSQRTFLKERNAIRSCPAFLSVLVILERAALGHNAALGLRIENVQHLREPFVGPALRVFSPAYNAVKRAFIVILEAGNALPRKALGLRRNGLAQHDRAKKALHDCLTLQTHRLHDRAVLFGNLELGLFQFNNLRLHHRRRQHQRLVIDFLFQILAACNNNLTLWAMILDFTSVPLTRIDTARIVILLCVRIGPSRV